MRNLSSIGPVLLVILAGISSVWCYPGPRVGKYLLETFSERDQGTDQFVESDAGGGDSTFGRSLSSFYYPSPPEKRDRKLETDKRATLNQLLQKLIALYGNNDINYSGRSVHMRFGAGKR